MKQTIHMGILILVVVTTCRSIEATEQGLLTAAEAESVRRFASTYCVKCHNKKTHEGDFDLEALVRSGTGHDGRDPWNRVRDVLDNQEMPPKEPLPTADERERIVGLLRTAIRRSASADRDAGHVTIPRLTRDEYNNSMRDLLGLDFQPGSLFQNDGEGQSGFSNDRDGLFLTPALMEKYFAAAERALDSIVALQADPIDQHFESESLLMTETREKPRDFGDGFVGYVLNRGQMTLYESVRFPFDGFYTFAVRGRSVGGPSGTRLRVNDEPFGDLSISNDDPAVYELTCFVPRGSHQMAWNIHQPAIVASATDNASPPAAADNSAREVMALPDNASTLVTTRSPLNAPRLATPEDATPAVARLIARMNASAVGVQRPYEWLRLHGPNGDRGEIVRFKGYIADRQKPLDALKADVAEALMLSRDDFEREYREQNVQRLADNEAILAAVRDVVAAKPRRSKKRNETKPGSVAIDWIQIRGPLEPVEMPAAAAAIIDAFDPAMADATAAHEFIRGFSARAFRRPVASSETGVDADAAAAERNEFVELYDAGIADSQSHTDALKVALAAVLVSPRFLFRVEQGQADGEFPLDNHQLASRLSYFLWLSMPDAELFSLADQGQLDDPAVVRRQVARMMEHPKFSEFARSFTGEWLGFASLGNSVFPDPDVFPQFNSDLGDAMKQETILAFASIFRDDRSLLELLDSSDTFLNAPLARHYGIRGVRGSAMQRVTLSDANRGGLLGMASILTTTSSAARTSPVIRGKWVLATLLGRDLPEPPPDAGELPGDAGEKDRTLREELLLHRRNPACATCHDRIDPIGFGLECFDGIGRFRTEEAGKPIDTSGELPGGIRFDGPVELKRYLLAERRTEFVTNVVRRTLSFALGRELHGSDDAEIDRIVQAVEQDSDRGRRLIEEIALSHPFRHQNNLPPAGVAE